MGIEIRKILRCGRELGVYSNQRIMRTTAATLILSFFVPAACAIATAWNTSSPTCSQTHHAPQPAPVVSPCCLNVAMERPALQEVKRHDNTPASAPAVPLENILLEVSLTNARVASRVILIGDTDPPPLYLLHASLLI